MLTMAARSNNYNTKRVTLTVEWTLDGPGLANFDPNLALVEILDKGSLSEPPAQKISGRVVTNDTRVLGPDDVLVPAGENGLQMRAWEIVRMGALARRLYDDGEVGIEYGDPEPLFCGIWLGREILTAGGILSGFDLRYHFDPKGGHLFCDIYIDIDGRGHRDDPDCLPWTRLWPREDGVGREAAVSGQP